MTIFQVPYLHLLRCTPPGKRSVHVHAFPDTVPIEIREVTADEAELVAVVDVVDEKAPRRVYRHLDGSFIQSSGLPVRHAKRDYASVPGNWHPGGSSHAPYPTDPLPNGFDTRLLRIFPVARSVTQGYDFVAKDLKDAVKGKTVIHASREECMRAIAGATDVEDTDETVLTLAEAHAMASGIVLVDGIPFRRCGEPFIHPYWHGQQEVRSHHDPSEVPDEIRRWPLWALDDLVETRRLKAEAEGSAFKLGPVPQIHLVRPDLFVAYVRPTAGLDVAVRDVLRHMCDALPRADIVYMAAFVDLRDAAATNDVDAIRPALVRCFGLLGADDASRFNVEAAKVGLDEETLRLFETEPALDMDDGDLAVLASARLSPSRP